MEVFKPGSRVKIDDLHGKVSQICIAGEACRVTYEVSWWDGRQHQEAWFDSGRVEQPHPNTIPIGFDHGTAEETD